MVVEVGVSMLLVVLSILAAPWVRLLAAPCNPATPRVFVLVIGMACCRVFPLLAPGVWAYD